MKSPAHAGNHDRSNLSIVMDCGVAESLKATERTSRTEGSTDEHNSKASRNELRWRQHLVGTFQDHCLYFQAQELPWEGEGGKREGAGMVSGQGRGGGFAPHSTLALLDLAITKGRTRAWSSSPPKGPAGILALSRGSGCISYE